VLGALAPVPHIKNLFEWDEAAEMLYEHYEHKDEDPRVSNLDQIKNVLDKEINHFEPTPGIRKYAVSDIQKFLCESRNRERRRTG
jgi:hypothetical protein